MPIERDDNPDFLQSLKLEIAIQPAQMERDTFIRMRQNLPGDSCPIQRFATGVSLPREDGGKIPS
jgi:hypothetical protein